MYPQTSEGQRKSTLPGDSHNYLCTNINSRLQLCEVLDNDGVATAPLLRKGESQGKKGQETNTNRNLVNGLAHREALL